MTHFKQILIRLALTAMLVIGISINLQGCAAVVVAGAAGGVALANDKRDTDTMVNDQKIEINVAGKISEDRQLAKQAHINVIAYNGVVLLTGEAPQQAMRDKAASIARQDKRVKRVYNAIKKMRPTSLKSRNNDTWITTKVKTQLLGKREINGLHVKVITENAHVFLMGLVPRKQGDIAAETASKVEGVKRVIKVFEYDS